MTHGSEDNSLGVRTTYDPKKVTLFLGTIMLCLFLANMLGIVSTVYFDQAHVFGLVPLFDLGEEDNVPTVFSALILLLCSGLFLAIAAVRKRKRQRDVLAWAGLAVVFLFLSSDELLQFHERLTTPMREFFATSGLLYFAWVIPYGICALTMLLIYLRFLLALTVKIRYLMILSGMIYLTGAVGFELIEGYWCELHAGRIDLTYLLITTSEETLEMIGMLVLVYALLSQINIELTDLSVRVRSHNPG